MKANCDARGDRRRAAHAAALRGHEPRAARWRRARLHARDGALPAPTRQGCHRVERGRHARKNSAISPAPTSSTQPPAEPQELRGRHRARQRGAKPRRHARIEPSRTPTCGSISITTSPTTTTAISLSSTPTAPATGQILFELFREPRSAADLRDGRQSFRRHQHRHRLVPVSEHHRAHLRDRRRAHPRRRQCRRAFAEDVRELSAPPARAAARAAQCPALHQPAIASPASRSRAETAKNARRAARGQRRTHRSHPRHRRRDRRGLFRGTRRWPGPHQPALEIAEDRCEQSLRPLRRRRPHARRRRAH